MHAEVNTFQVEAPTYDACFALKKETNKNLELSVFIILLFHRISLNIGFKAYLSN